MANINTALSDSEIMLEPRIAEYLSKLQYYRDNRIKPGVPLEKQYSISKEDEILISRHLRGEKQLYKREKRDHYLDLVEHKKTKFESSDLHNDRRFDRLKKKMQRDRDAAKQRNNYSNYQFESKISNGIEEELQEYDDENYYKESNDNLFLDSKRIPFDNQYRINNVKPGQALKHQVAPKIAYKQQNHYEDNFRKQKYLTHDNDILPTISNISSYSNKVNKIYQHSAEMDKESKVNVPAVNSRGKTYYNTSAYQPIPLRAAKITHRNNYTGEKLGLKDIGLETCLRDGFSDGIAGTRSKAKSHDYENPVEHYFDYISNDIQDPNHCVFPMSRGGVNTRDDNHKTSRPYYAREIIN